jgi:hypothetical protein
MVRNEPSFGGSAVPSPMSRCAKQTQFCPRERVGRPLRTNKANWAAWPTVRNKANRAGEQPMASALWRKGYDEWVLSRRRKNKANFGRPGTGRSQRNQQRGLSYKQSQSAASSAIPHYSSIPSFQSSSLPVPSLASGDGYPKRDSSRLVTHARRTRRSVPMAASSRQNARNVVDSGRGVC